MAEDYVEDEGENYETTESNESPEKSRRLAEGKQQEES